MLNNSNKRVIPSIEYSETTLRYFWKIQHTRLIIKWKNILKGKPETTILHFYIETDSHFSRILFNINSILNYSGSPSNLTSSLAFISNFDTFFNIRQDFYTSTTDKCRAPPCQNYFINTDSTLFCCFNFSRLSCSLTGRVLHLVF